MDVRLVGTGGSGGWPQPGCRCASCAQAAAAGRRRAPAQVLVDGMLRLRAGPEPPATGAPPGYQVGRLPGGWTVAGPDGVRLDPEIMRRIDAALGPVIVTDPALTASPPARPAE